MKNKAKKDNAFTKAFKKVKDYIKNTAWIQPLLIVVIIFLVLFLLNPIKTGITNLVDSISTSSKMETITYEEYTQKIKASADADHSNGDEKILIVFTAKDCDHCKDLYPVMNKYLKERTYDFEIYSVNLTTKEKSNGDVIYKKDKTAGYASGNKDNDATWYLDERIEEWNEEVNTDSSLLTEVSYDDDWTGYKYTYLATPLFVWYINGSEVKISNSFDSLVTSDDDGDKDYDSFKSFISFKGLEVDEDWARDNKFNLEAKPR